MVRGHPTELLIGWPSNECSLPSFKSRGTEYESVYYGINNDTRPI